MRPGPPCEMRIVGRLNLFSSSALETVWRAIPSPRRVIIDLGTATDIDAAGRDALHTFLRTREAGSRAAISLEGAGMILSGAFPSGEPVYPTRNEAIAALGDLSDMSKSTVEIVEQTGVNSAN